MLRRILKNRFISLAILFSFLTVSFASIAHTHKMAAKAPEHCNLCQAGHQIRTVDTPILQKAALPIFEKTVVGQAQAVPCFFVSSSLNLSRAPPLV
ncbi:MAG: hypothetical protein Q7S98_00175 [Deltaproteobacteria bacterium]|nr:hypothetical protein [Deltaproteobacteria bacterium]